MPEAGARKRCKMLSEKLKAKRAGVSGGRRCVCGLSDRALALT
jgi:hypothetical protein